MPFGDVVDTNANPYGLPEWLDDWIWQKSHPPRKTKAPPTSPGAPTPTPPRKSYPTEPRSPGQAPRVRPGIPQAPLAGPIFNGIVGSFVKANLLTSVLMQIGQELFNQLPQGDETGGLLNKAAAARLQKEFAYQTSIIGGGPSRRGGAGRRTATATGAMGAPPRRDITATVTPGAPVQPVRSPRVASTSPMAAPPNAANTGAATQSAPVAPGTTATQPVIVPKVLGAPVTPLPKPTAQPPKVYNPGTWFPPVKPMVKTFFSDLMKGELALLQAKILAPGRTRKRQAFFEPQPVPEPPIQEQPLTQYNYQGVGYDTTTDTCATKKRKPGKKRTVCYAGTYRERATGLSKSKGKRIPCLQSRSKSRS
jgi:hypothetical protein